MDKPAADMTPIIYAHRLHELQTIVRASGYALAIHGSMKNDLDAIAVPWTKNATDADTLVARICEQMNLTIAEGSPTKRLHGRRIWTLLLHTVGFIDLSVLPRNVDMANLCP